MVLDSYSPIYFGMAYSTNNKVADYYCLLYIDNNNNPVIVLESETGTNYTKVAFPTEIIDSEEKFIEFCRKCLELSNNESLTAGNIIRFKHSNIEEFNSNISLVVNGIEEGKEYHPRKLERLEKINKNMNK